MNFRRIIVLSILFVSLGLVLSCNQAEKPLSQASTEPTVEAPKALEPAPSTAKPADTAKAPKQDKQPTPQPQSKLADKPAAKEASPPSVVEKPADATRKSKEAPPVIESAPKPELKSEPKPEPKPNPPVVEVKPIDPPAEIVFKATLGDVTFFHAKHIAREKQCVICHDSIFPKDKTKPLNFKGGMHQTATANKTSCATCHVPDGKAFVVKGNCMKCHKNK